MKPLTLCIMCCDNPNDDLPLSTISDSVGDVVEQFVLLSHRDLDKALETCETEWFMYLFSNEQLSEGLKDLLPRLMSLSEYETYVFFERRKNAEGGYSYGKSPRLFKSNLSLNGMVPLNTNKNALRMVLDGFVEG